MLDDIPGIPRKGETDGLGTLGDWGQVDGSTCELSTRGMRSRSLIFAARSTSRPAMQTRASNDTRPGSVSSPSGASMHRRMASDSSIASSGYTMTSINHRPQITSVRHILERIGTDEETLLGHFLRSKDLLQDPILTMHLQQHLRQRIWGSLQVPTDDYLVESPWNRQSPFHYLRLAIPPYLPGQHHRLLSWIIGRRLFRGLQWPDGTGREPHAPVLWDMGVVGDRLPPGHLQHSPFLFPILHNDHCQEC